MFDIVRTEQKKVYKKTKKNNLFLVCRLWPVTENRFRKNRQNSGPLASVPVNMRLESVGDEDSGETAERIGGG